MFYLFLTATKLSWNIRLWNIHSRCKSINFVEGCGLHKSVIMLSSFLLVLVAVTTGCYGDASSGQWLGQLPWATRDNLLQLQPHLNIKQLTGPPIPLYRPDLGEAIAYWFISYNNDQFAVVSAGDHTDDNMLVLQGEGLSPVTALQRRASQEHNVTCLRYLLLTPSPDVNLACDTLHGRVVERDLHSQNVTALWEEMKLKKKGKENKDENDASTIHLRLISSSQPASFPVLGMRDCHIRPLGQSNGSDIGVRVLCKLLGVCDENGRVHLHRKTEYGEVYVHLEPVLEDWLPRFEHDLHFEVVATHQDGGIISKGFAVEPSHRAKRQSSYTVYSIDDRNLMPDYNQFEYNSCQVGCGPVAWAQVFGYYDRRAHAGRGSSASDALYRCGTDGTTGSDSCQAPPSNDQRMRNYISKLNDIMGTFCLFGQGATYQGSMDDVEGFFRERQGSSGDVVLKANGNFLTRLVGTYSDSIRNDGLSFLRQKWPVIVGFRVSGLFSQHYAVMTQYRTRTVRKKVCTLGINCRTEDVREYDMYLHMGWGGSQNGWRKAEMFMAAVAKY